MAVFQANLQTHVLAQRRRKRKEERGGVCLITPICKELKILLYYGRAGGDWKDKLLRPWEKSPLPTGHGICPGTKKEA